MSTTFSHTSQHSIFKSVSLNKKGQIAETCKMISVVLIPIITLSVLTSFSLQNTVKIKESVFSAQKGMATRVAYSKLVLAMQIERGITTMYLASAANRDKFMKALIEARQHVNNAVTIISILHPIKMFNVTINSHSDFIDYLSNHRILVHMENRMSYMENLHFFTNIINSVLDNTETAIDLVFCGILWKQFVSFDAILRASDVLGIIRALGASFYIKCSLTEEERNYLMDMDGQFHNYLTQAFIYHPELETYHAKRLNELQAAHGDTDSYSKYILQQDAENVCHNASDEYSMKQSMSWFQNATEYIDILHDMHEQLHDGLVAVIASKVKETENSFITYTVVLVIVSSVGLFLGISYTWSIHSMITNLTSRAKQLIQSKRQLEQEKHRGERLLCLMLPPTVVHKLKHQEELVAELFDNATIYFSDLNGFTALSAQSTPHQIVHFLNDMYSKFDTIIDKYDVYKVETIGDAYMVASGLPNRNGNLHAKEIAIMSLDLRDVAEKFVIPHMPNQTLRLRSGIHSGPCVAGIVGRKMYRYGVFGDTVTTASLMESTSEVQKIQISETTWSLLNIIGGFTMEKRGHVTVTGKGTIETYWLLSCINR